MARGVLWMGAPGLHRPHVRRISRGKDARRGSARRGHRAAPPTPPTRTIRIERGPGECQSVPVVPTAPQTAARVPYHPRMATFLLKTEPGTYSFDDLLREKRTAWSGVTNPGALINLRSAKKGDEAFIYHTGDEKAIVGLARVVSAPYEDPARPGKTPDGKPKFAVIDIEQIRRARTPLSLAAMRADKRFKDFLLLKNSRLSVMPVPAELDKMTRSIAGL
jgi:predicted RNA-binding protein with PUA-like domain